MFYASRMYVDKILNHSYVIVETVIRVSLLQDRA